LGFTKIDTWKFRRAIVGNPPDGRGGLLRLGPSWEKALSGKLPLVHDTDQEGPSKKRRTTKGTEQEEAHDQKFQVGDCVMCKASGYPNGADGYPEGYWPAKIIGIEGDNKFKIKWDQVVAIF
jgi:hypothetical protein